jgi:hypothetical protein
MLDRDLADLYGVETKRLKEQVRRNTDRFPPDFMFELTKDEFENWRSQFATSKGDKKGLRYAPMAFTEQGVAKLYEVETRIIKRNIRRYLKRFSSEFMFELSYQEFKDLRFPIGISKKRGAQGICRWPSQNKAWRCWHAC